MMVASGRNGDITSKPDVIGLLRSLKALKNCRPVAADATTLRYKALGD